jgi:hypothetical protein
VKHGVAPAYPTTFQPLPDPATLPGAPQ